MKNRISQRAWLISLLFSFIFILTTNQQTVQAALTDSEDLNVLKDAPDGIAISKYMSNAQPNVTASGDIYTNNSAQIVDHSGNNTSDGNVISLASAHNTYGSMWSTDQTFDINKPQTISAWLYFGSGTGDTSDINSEGIAFVLQNDSNGVAALGAGLEGMGVYGYDASRVNLVAGSAPTQSYIKSTAVQNSIALEFDSSLNDFFAKVNGPINNNGTKFPTYKAYYSLNGYDTQYGKTLDSSLGFPSTAKYGAGGTFGHIAATYPGLEASYQLFDLTLNNYAKANYQGTFTNGYILVHIKPNQAPELINDTDSSGNPVYWHHITIDWTPPESGSTNGTLTYNYNDLYKDGTKNTNTTNSNFKKVTDSIQVDTSKLNTTSGKVRWGFTGANGPSTSVASKLVAFDSLPNLLYATADGNIVDTTLGNKKITDTSTDKTVANGDDLQLNYNLKYVRGDVAWQKIAANIEIPTNVTLNSDSSGNVAYITYADGSTEAISSSEVSDGSLEHTLAKAIGTQADASGGTSATVTISAKANNDTDKDIDVKSAAAVFKGSDEISTTNSPAFTILAPKKYTLKLANTNTTNDIDLLYNSDNAALNLPTELTYSDSHSFGDSNSSTDIIYEITAGGKTYTVGSSATGTSFDQTIDLKSLINDDTAFWKLFSLNSTNQVTIKAIDQANGLTSNTLTYNVNTKPNKTLSMTVSKNLKFKDINYTDDTEYLPRSNNFDLSVTSLRSPWKLDVSTDGMYLDGTTLNDKMALVYKKDADASYQTLSSTPTQIESNKNSYDTDTTDDISDDWTNKTGLLLKQLGTSQAGQYTGTLTWILSDSVE